MYCRKCGASLPDNARFCSKCGNVIQAPAGEARSSGPAAGGSYSAGPAAGGPYSSGPAAGGPYSAGPAAGGPYSAGPAVGGPYSAGPAAGDTGSAGTRTSDATGKWLLVMGLILLSGLLLMASWITTSRELVRDISVLRNDIYDLLDEAEYYADWVGIDVDTAALREVGDMFLDGKLSPAEMFTLCKELVPLLNDINRTLGRWDEPDSGLTFIAVISAIYMVLIAACAVAAVLAVVMVLLRRGFRADILFGVLQSVLFGAFVLICVFSVEELEFFMRPTVLSVVSVALAWTAVGMWSRLRRTTA